MANYWLECFKLGASDTEKALAASHEYGAYGKHPLTAADRLGDPDLPFPIAFAYGDRDWLGSVGGAD